jgi:tRNA nucleotidyltransferase (CCA-adding enzyme)
MKEIVKKILKEIKPEKNEEIDNFIKILKKNIKAEINLGGSFAKNTHIGKDYDCDIFVRFDLKEKNISKKLFDSLNKISKKLKFNIEIIHGSRDYYNFKYKNINFEIVPVYKIKQAEDAENIMDMSPFHVKWIKENIKNLNDDIRLIKKLFKAQKIYGAESFIKGFSGHVVDILVIHYGGFKKTLQQISKWPKTSKKNFKKIVIDQEKYYKNKDVLFYMNKSKTISPLIVVDPIIKERNAAAALGNFCYNKAIDVAKEFLKKPSLEKFKKIPLENKFKKQKNTFVIKFKPLRGSKDVSGSKIMKAYRFITKEIQKQGFEIIESDWDFQEERIYISVKDQKIPKKFLQKGPSINMKQAVTNFKKAHPKSKFKTENETLYVELNRKNTEFSKCLDEILKKEYLKQKVKVLNYHLFL